MRSIKKIAVFYNNFRGFYLVQELVKKNYYIEKILAKKNINYDVLKKNNIYIKCKKNSTRILKSNLKLDLLYSKNKRKICVV